MVPAPWRPWQLTVRSPRAPNVRSSIRSRSESHRSDRQRRYDIDVGVDYTKAPFRKNSVLVFGNEKAGMPARIVEKLEGTHRRLYLLRRSARA